MKKILEMTNIGAMASRAKSLAKIRVSESEVQETITKILLYINLFNTLDKYDKLVFNRPLEDIIILNEFAHWVEPASVQFDPSDLECTELLDVTGALAGMEPQLVKTMPVRKIEKIKTVKKERLDSGEEREIETVEEVVAFNSVIVEIRGEYGEYLDLLSRFRAYFKSSIQDNATNLGAIRKFVSWSEIMPNCAYTLNVGTEEEPELEMWVKYANGVPFIPIHVKSFMSQGWKDRHFNATAGEVLDEFVEKWLI